jgi:uncharacterized protein
MSRVLRFSVGSALPEPWYPPRTVSGSPEGITRNAYESADGRKYVGHWESTVGSWEVAYTEWEYCLMLEGRVRITGRDGVTVEAGPGDSLVIEPGFKGVWEVVEPAKKLYVIDLPPTDVR